MGRCPTVQRDVAHLPSAWPGRVLGFILMGLKVDSSWVFCCHNIYTALIHFIICVSCGVSGVSYGVSGSPRLFVWPVWAVINTVLVWEDLNTEEKK